MSVKGTRPMLDIHGESATPAIMDVVVYLRSSIYWTDQWLLASSTPVWNFCQQPLKGSSGRNLCYDSDDEQETEELYDCGCDLGAHFWKPHCPNSIDAGPFSCSLPRL